MCDMRALGAAPKTLASYFEEKYNKSYIYKLLEGYRRAYAEKCMPVLAGFAWYAKGEKS